MVNKIYEKLANKNDLNLLGKFADWVETEWGARFRRVADLSWHVVGSGGRHNRRLCTHSQIVKSMYERLQLHLLNKNTNLKDLFYYTQCHVGLLNTLKMSLKLSSFLNVVG